jgi:hypothetical protein
MGERRVKNPVATIRNEDFPILLPPQYQWAGLLNGADHPVQGTPGGRQPERNHFYWQWKAAELRDPFALVCDHNHACRGRCNYLFP